MFTNVFPIELDFESFTITRVSYTEDTLKDLREKHNATHSFFKNGTHIYISNKSGEDLTIGTPYEFNVFEESDITLSIMRHIFFKTFLERFKDRLPLEFHPFRILSTRSDDDWVYDLLPGNLKNKLGYKKQIELQIKAIEVSGTKQFALVANIERRWVFSVDCKELLAIGFDSTGYEIIHSEIIQGLQNILAPTEEFIGRIAEIHGEVAVVESADGKIEINLNELFLSKNKL